VFFFLQLLNITRQKNNKQPLYIEDFSITARGQIIGNEYIDFYIAAVCNLNFNEETLMHNTTSFLKVLNLHAIYIAFLLNKSQHQYKPL